MKPPEMYLSCLEGCDITSKGSFILLLEVRLESLLFCLPCIMVFAVVFPVAVINSYC